MNGMEPEPELPDAAAAEAKKAAGNLAFKAKKFKQAVALYGEAIVLDPRNPVYFCNRSTCYANLGDWRASMNDASKTVELDSASVKGWSRLAKAHLSLYEVDETREALERGLALDGANKDLLKIKERLDELVEPLIAPGSAEM